MRGVRRNRVGVEDFADIDALPADAAALFGGDPFSTLAWYRSTQRAALSPGEQALFQVASQNGVAQAVFPMLRTRHAFAALTTPYTCLWQPLLAPGLDAACLPGIGCALADSWRQQATLRLDALDASTAWWPALRAGFRRAGLHPLPFDHFGNWHLAVEGLAWTEYLAARPGQLREAIRRRGKRLMKSMGARFTLVTSPDGLSAAIDSYEKIYDTSWKEPEPFPRFSADLMQACAGEGTLRLGVLWLQNAPIAAQFWLVQDRRAYVLKLAHDEAHKALAPGTVLMAIMIRHLLEQDTIVELDFGRGDDPYKQLWTGERRQRSGLILANPLRPSGLIEIARHHVGKIRKGARPPAG